MHFENRVHIVLVHIVYISLHRLFFCIFMQGLGKEEGCYIKWVDLAEVLYSNNLKCQFVYV